MGLIWKQVAIFCRDSEYAVAGDHQRRLRSQQRRSAMGMNASARVSVHVASETQWKGGQLSPPHLPTCPSADTSHHTPTVTVSNATLSSSSTATLSVPPRLRSL